MSYLQADQASLHRAGRFSAGASRAAAPGHTIALWLRHASHLGPVALLTLLAAVAAAHAVRMDGAWQILLVATVALNVGLLALSSWPAILGFALGAFGGAANQGQASAPGELVPSWPTGRARTAVLVPIYEEDPARVFAAVEVMRAALAVTGAGEVAFFVLSDTQRSDSAAAEADGGRSRKTRAF